MSFVLNEPYIVVWMKGVGMRHQMLHTPVLQVPPYKYVRLGDQT